MSFAQFSDVLAQAKTFATTGSAKLKEVVGDLDASSKQPSFDDQLEKAVQAIVAAQGALCRAVSLAPPGERRKECRDNLSAVHEKLGTLCSTIQDLKTTKPAPPQSKAASAPTSYTPPPSKRASAPSSYPAATNNPPAAAPVADLIGGGDFAAFASAPAPAPAKDFADFASAPTPAPAFGDFADFTSAPTAPPATSPDTADLLGGGGFDAFSPSPPSVSASVSANSSFTDLLNEPSQPSLDDLINGMSAVDELNELNMATPLMPVGGMNAVAVEPEKRLKLPGAMQENAPPEPEESQSQIEKRVKAWQEGKNLQAMLASLHEIAPKCCRWEPRTIGQLLDEAALKDAYKLSLIAVHPDKLGDRPEWERARCQLIFNSLRRNRPRSNTAA